MSLSERGPARYGGRADWRDPAAVTVFCAALLVVAAVSMTVVDGLTEPTVALAFGGLIAFGELVRLRLPDDRMQAPIGLAGALGYALLAHVPQMTPSLDDRAMHSVLQTVMVAGGGMLVGALPHVLTGRASELESIARNVLVVAAVAVVFRPLVLNDTANAWLEGRLWGYPVVTVIAVLMVWPLEAALAAGVNAGRVRSRRYFAFFRNELSAYLGIGSAIASTGVLIALATWEIGLWALPLVSIPLLLAQLAYRRYTGIRWTQIQTIRALSRTTEVGGYTETGHARRVAELALAVGRDLGLSESRLRLLHYAALMHDLGQLSLADPIPGGATVFQAPDERRRIAARGAAVVRQTGVMEEVAVIVEAQAEQYRRPHIGDDIDVPLESRIIKVVNAYDDLAGASTAEDVRQDALEELRLGMAYEYDPTVVASLARIIDRYAVSLV